MVNTGHDASFTLQYVSCSWDKTIRVWNAWKKQVKRKEVEEDGEGKSDKMKKVEISTEGVEEWEEEGEGQEGAKEGEEDGEGEGTEELEEGVEAELITCMSESGTESRNS